MENSLDSAYREIYLTLNDITWVKLIAIGTSSQLELWARSALTFKAKSLPVLLRRMSRRDERWLVLGKTISVGRAIPENFSFLRVTSLHPIKQESETICTAELWMLGQSFLTESEFIKQEKNLIWSQRCAKAGWLSEYVETWRLISSLPFKHYVTEFFQRIPTHELWKCFVVENDLPSCSIIATTSSLPISPCCLNLHIGTSYKSLSLLMLTRKRFQRDL